MLINAALSEALDSVIILDQTLLPNKEVYIELREPHEMHEAIKSLRVRGAPCIGKFAAYAVYVFAKNYASGEGFYEALCNFGEYLNSARPTAVNLSWAVKRMLGAAKGMRREEAAAALYEECRAVAGEDEEICSSIAELGLTLVKDGDGILTHCNAGGLAASGYGTGLGAILLGRERGYDFKVYCDETRPLMQGARLTAYELNKAGVNVTLICDNMAGYFMKGGRINACFAGCDRVAANGDAANKIGTLSVAVLARHFGIPFYVFCPSSTVDFGAETGADIKIEERGTDEIKTLLFKEPVAGPEIKCLNPAFDVTDNNLITAIITEKGIIRGNYKTALKELFK